MRIKFISVCASAIALVLSFGLSLQAAAVPDSTWQPVVSSDGSVLTARHEAAAVTVGDSLYLFGGRGNRPVERYSSSTGQWDNLGLAPMELHHFQPVVVGEKIYVLGAFTCCYPRETLVSEIHIFNTETELWTTQGSLPVNRVRGSASAVVRNDKIYLLGGNTEGHDGGAVSWFDEYDPATDVWRQLDDAPHARDHFSTVIIDDQLIAAAGRQTALPSPAANPVLETDIYDFATEQWTSAAPIPTGRSGAVAVSYGNYLVVAGGEINTSSVALKTVEAFDIELGTWATWPSMNSGRHGSGGGVTDGHFYMLSGATTIGGANESGTSEFLMLPDLPEEPVVPPTGTDTGAGTDTGTDAGAGTDTGTDAGAGTDAGTDAGAGSDTGTDSGAGTDAGTDAGAGTDTGTDTGTDAGAGTDTGTDAGTDTGAETGSESTNTGRSSGAASGFLIAAMLILSIHRRRRLVASSGRCV